MEKQTLIKILNGDLSVLESVDANDDDLNIDIIVSPNHVRNMLNGYLRGDYNSYDLNRWARFIRMRTEYCCPNYWVDEVADYYESMFNVIQWLSTPEIDGEINVINVKSYLAELEKYPKD